MSVLFSLSYQWEIYEWCIIVRGCCCLSYTIHFISLLHAEHTCSVSSSNTPHIIFCPCKAENYSDRNIKHQIRDLRVSLTDTFFCFIRLCTGHKKMCSSPCTYYTLKSVYICVYALSLL